MSISLKVVSIAAVCCASTRRLAMVARRLLIRTRSSLRAARGCLGWIRLSGLTGLDWLEPGCGRLRRGCGRAGRWRLPAIRRTSARPPSSPGRRRRSRTPSTRSTPCSLGHLLRGRRGLDVCRSRLSRVELGAVRLAPGAGRCLVLARVPASCPPEPRRTPASMTPSTSPTLTSSPSLRSMRARTPADSALTSRSILSVSSSTSGSPAATASPSFFSQRAMRASMTDSPNCGTTIFIGAPG